MMNQQKLLKPWSLLACVTALAGCGGGSGSAPVPSKVDLSTSIAAMQGPFDQPQPLQLTVTNSGQAAVLNLSVKASDTILAVASDTCSGKALAAGASCTVSYSAKPTAAGQGSVGVTVQYSGDDGAGSKALSVPYNFEGSQWDMVPVWANEMGSTSNSGYVSLALNADRFRLAWQYVPSIDGLNVSGITSDRDRIYLSAEQASVFFEPGWVLAVSQRDGSLSWQTPLGVGRGAYPLEYTDGLIYVQSSAGQDLNETKLDAATGAVLAQYTKWCGHGQAIRTIYGDPGVVRFCAGNLGSSVSVGNRKSGREWGFNFLPPPAGVALDAKRAYLSIINSRGANMDARLVVISLESGQIEYQSNNLVRDNLAPDLAPGLVLDERSARAFLEGYGRMDAIDLSSGETLWTTSCCAGRLAYGNQIVYAVSKDDSKMLHALDAKTGTRLWSWSVPDPFASNLVITQSHLFAATATNTYAFNLSTRSVDWFQPKGGDRLLLTNTGNLIIADAKAKLTAISLR